MKYLFFIFILILNLNSFGQIKIEKTRSIKIEKKEIRHLGQTSFSKNILISNTENQPFVTVNIVIKGRFSDDIDLLVRYKTNEWSSWQNLSEDIHLKTVGFIYKEMFYLPQEVTEFEFKGNFSSKVKGLRIDFFYPEFTENLTANTVFYNDNSLPAAVNCNCPIPAFEARLDWCPSGNCPGQQSPTYTTVTHLIVHHSAGPNTSTDWAATVRSIWNFHVNTRGWSDIGYNYLVAPSGVIYEGRGDNVLGAHFSGMNGGTMGICLLGDYEPSSGNGTPSNIMISKLEELLSWKECDLDIDPLLSSYHSASSQTLFNVSGHRDAGTGTVCPGDNVFNLLPNIRTACSSYMTNCSFVSDADLVVSSVAINPSPILLNQNVVIDYAIGNGGSLSVTDSIKVDLEIDGVLIETNFLDSLSAGNIANFNIANYLFDTIGSHSICVYISHALNETNVANNSYCKTVSVIEEVDFSDIRIASFNISQGDIDINEEAVVDFSFQNIGDISTSEAVQAKIKVDGLVKQLFTIPVLAVNGIYSKNFSYNFNTVGEHEFCIEVNSPTNEIIISNNSNCKGITVFTISGVDELINVTNLNVFPNPVERMLSVKLALIEYENVKFSLKNVLGQSLYSYENGNSLFHNEKINVSSFSKDIYFLNIQIGSQYINKIIIIE